MVWDKPRILAALCVALGALSALMLLGGVWAWVGLACAAVAVFLGWRGIKTPGRFVAGASLLGIGLALVCTLANVVLASFFSS